MLAPPRPPSRAGELEALIREARARQRKRWIGGAALLAFATGAAVAVSVLVPAGDGRVQARRSGPSAASTPRCTGGQLRVGKARFDGVYTAHVVGNMAFRNVSAHSCSLKGRPSFDVVLSGGRRVVARVGYLRNTRPHHDVGVPAADILLRPGGAASFHIVANDGTGLEEACGFPLPMVKVLVIPPGTRTPARGSTTMPYCHNPRRLLVLLTPLVAGPVDRYSFE
jgi:uncharacterized protein DUF4232